jgi:hypothetical protein
MGRKGGDSADDTSGAQRACPAVPPMPPFPMVVLGLGAPALPSNAIQLAAKGHDAQVAQVVVKKVLLSYLGRVLELVNLCEHKIFKFILENVAGCSHTHSLGKEWSRLAGETDLRTVPSETLMAG